MINDATESHLTPEFEERAREELDRLQFDLFAVNLKLTSVQDERDRLADKVQALERLLGEPQESEEDDPPPTDAVVAAVGEAGSDAPAVSARDLNLSPMGRRLESRFRRRRFRRRSDALSAAMGVLCEAQQPLHYVELTKRMLDSGKWTTTGDTPARSVNSLVSMDIVNNGDDSPFVRYDRGVYALREWGDEVDK